VSINHSIRDKIIFSIIATFSVALSAFLIGIIAIPINSSCFLTIVITSLLAEILLLIGAWTGWIDNYESWDKR
jgi:hypothetical protein